MRPILVLALVIVAIAALIFGVMRLLPETPTATDPTTTSATARTSEPTKPPLAGPSSLDGGGDEAPDRAVQTPTDAPSRKLDPSAISGFDNVLSGLVRNPQGAPVSGAEVTISTANTSNLFFVNEKFDTSKDMTQRTDGEGRFAFRNVEPRERYRITVKHPEYTRYEDTSIPVGDAGTFQEPPITLTQGATLSGTVRDEGGNAVNDATILLDGMIYQGSIYVPPDRMTGKSDREGRFTIVNVPKGQRILTVMAQGYGTITVNGLVFDREEALTRDVTLKVGEMICGKVVDRDSGQGIPEARITAIGFSSTQQSARGDAVADAKGDFCLENLTPGPYNVMAVAKGFRAERNQRVETGTNNVTLEMIREPNVSGQVVDAATNAPITAFTVRLRFFYGPGLPTAPSEISQTFNSANGEFTLEGVPQSEWVVEGQAPGYAPSFSNNFTLANGKSVTGIVVRMTQGGSISGRVVDGAGKPIARARITTHDKEWVDDDFAMILGSEYPTNITAAEVRSNDDGTFSIGNLQPEVYQVQIQAVGCTRWSRNDIVVREGAPTKLEDVTLARGGTLRGTVFDPAGKPLAGAAITLGAVDGLVAERYTTKSGDDGKFLITNITPRTYVLSASRAGALGGNPFEQVIDTKNSEKRVVITEERTTVQDLTLSD
jgi:uncharacterized GH25 family protein